MTNYKYHKLADIFPLIAGQEYEDLVSDIKANGLVEDIILLDNRILDGRNRYRACLDAKVKPRFREFKGQSPAAYVISKNLSRRHLTSSQKAVIALDALPYLEAEARKRQVRGKTINSSEKGESREIASEMFCTNHEYIQQAKKVKKDYPEMFEAIKNGEMTINDAKREMAKTVIHENMKAVKVKDLQGQYDVIVIAPPWQVNETKTATDSERCQAPYLTMRLEEIGNLRLPMADNCHVFLWTTNCHLPHAFDILKEWNLKYICTFVWTKEGGFQPLGLPQLNCEYVLYAVKGAPVFVDTKNFSTDFNFPKTKNDEKPEAFYNLLLRVTDGVRLDMFSRRKIKGFDSWGIESKKKLRVIIGCEESQAVTIEFRNRGHDAFSCDLQPCSGGHPEWHFQEDILKVLKREHFDIGIFHPPCTHLCCSGARHFEKKRADGRQRQGIKFFMELVNAPIDKIAVENPVGIMSKLYRQPDQIIHPYYFGDPYQKATCLWLKNLLPLASYPNHAGKGDFYLSPSGKKLPKWYSELCGDGKGRSKTFPGIAKAMAEQWSEDLTK